MSTRPLYNCLTCGGEFSGPTAADTWIAHTVPSCATKRRQDESDARLAAAAIKPRNDARQVLVDAFEAYLKTDYADLADAIDLLAGYCEGEDWPETARILAAAAKEIQEVNL